MQASLSTRSAGCTRPCASRTRSVVVRASANDSRRAVLSGLVGGVALSLAASSQALTPVDLFDDRKVKSTGFDNIYEARDASLPQQLRDGTAQAKADLATTKTRVKESESRIDGDLEPYIQKAYWTEAREQLRRQLYTLRFDLNTLASSKPKEQKKQVLALKKDFIAKVEALDYSLRSKDKESALKTLNSTKSALDAVLAVAL